MGKKSGPPPPDYTGAAEATSESNREALTSQTWANRASQSSPWGAETWEAGIGTDPATGQQVTTWNQKTTLDPRLQATLDTQLDVQGQRSRMAQGLLGRAEQEVNTPIDYSGLSDWARAPGTGGIQTGLDFGGVQGVEGAQQARQRAEDAMYQSATSRLDPQWDKKQRQMEAQLANSGISRNSAAYKSAMDDLQKGRTDAYQQAQLASFAGGGAEAQRQQGMDLALRGAQVGEIGQQGAFANQAQGLQFGQGLQAATFGNQQRQQQLAEMLSQRGYSLNEITALMNGQQVNMPNFSSYGQSGNAGGTDYSGAASNAYGAQMSQQNAQNAATGQAVAGIGSAAAIAAMAFSDRATKVVLRRIARDPRGFGIWLFRYIGESAPRVGVVAQEVRRYVPAAVHDVRGVLRVDYAMLANGG